MKGYLILEFDMPDWEQVNRPVFPEVLEAARERLTEAEIERVTSVRAALGQKGLTETLALIQSEGTD